MVITNVVCGLAADSNSVHQRRQLVALDETEEPLIPLVSFNPKPH